jgi:putative acetyltransferase
MDPRFAVRIIRAETPDEIRAAGLLFREYAAWLAIDLSFQNFEEELANLPGDYAPPDGRFAAGAERD